VLRIIIAVIIAAAGSGIIALAAPTASADECQPGYYWSKIHGNCVERPDNNPVGATAQCADGLYSHSETPGASENCSGHGGVVKQCPCGGAAAPASISSADADDQPDPETYLFMLRKANIASSDKDALAVGQQVCNQARGGIGAAALIAQLRNYPGNALTFSQAAEIVVAATEQLCPGGDLPVAVWHDAMLYAGHDPNNPNS